MSVSSNLLVAVGTMDTVLSLADTTNFPVDGGVVLIGTEKIFFATATDRTLIGCVRGAQGTTAATHAINALVSLIESFPFSQVMGSSSLVNMQMPSVFLVDPVAVPTAALIEANTLISVTLDGSGANQTWTLPSLEQSHALMLVITFVTPASFTL